MIKRNLAALFIIASSLIGIVNTDYSHITNAKEYIPLIISALILIASIYLIYTTETTLKHGRKP